jgi:hypothetical protein
MKWFIVFMLAAGFYNGQAQTGSDYVEMMFKRNAGKWYRTLTFIQTTRVFRHDSLLRTATWFEAVKFPYQFRIDTDSAAGNGVIYSRDSSYRFKNNEFVNATAGGNPFTFALGGMYFMPFDSVKAEFARTGYDLSRGYQTFWKGKRTFVIGNAENDSSGNSLWIDADNLYVVRTIETDQGRHIDAQMEGQKKIGGGWSETKVNIFINGSLVQVEEYHNLSADTPLDDNIYDIHSFGRHHWFKKN